MDRFTEMETFVRVVEDGETLSLGRRTLQFVSTPFVHWPETMMTYMVEQKVLFPCDGFGGYGALQGYAFDDECTDIDYYKKESLRYYSNIVAKFSKPVLNAIDKLGGIDVVSCRTVHFTSSACLSLAAIRSRD